MPDVLDLIVDPADHAMKYRTSKKLYGCQNTSRGAWVPMQHTRRVSQTYDGHMLVKNGMAEGKYKPQSLGLRSPRPSWNCLIE
jgi:hypothetical protein